MKNAVLFCTGVSGTGKSHFIKNYLSDAAFYNLKSATTRPMREGEQDGREYYFRDEKYFDNEKFATKLWVNEQFWQPGMPKWLYGVPENEIFYHLGHDFTYDVIQPCYVRQMIDWFRKRNLTAYYEFKILWFQPWQTIDAIVKERKNMPNDLKVRQTNTCNRQDFTKAHLVPDFTLLNSPQRQIINDRIKTYIQSLISDYAKQK